MGIREVFKTREKKSREKRLYHDKNREEEMAKEKREIARRLQRLELQVQVMRRNAG